MIIVGIDIAPAVVSLVRAGPAAGNGVEVDELCRTGLPDVYAIGDCAAHVNAFAGSVRVRVESVQNATDQANCVARAIAGDPRPLYAVSWFWSNQYDLRLQTVGLSVGFEEALVRGDPQRRRFSVIYLRNRSVIALDCINAPQAIRGSSVISPQSSQAAHLGGCRSAAGKACARWTARSFGSSTEIVSSASLQSRRFERGSKVAVQGRSTSTVKKAARLSSWAIDRSMRAGDPFDMTAEVEQTRKL